MPTIRPRSDAGPFSCSGLFGSIHANPLIRHDWLLFRNGFRKAFANLRDRLLLLAIGGIALAALAEAIAHPVPVSPLAVIAIMALGGVMTQHSARMQLAWLGAHSFLAAPALDPRFGRHYLYARHAVALGPLVMLLLLLRPAGLITGVTAYLGGVLFARMTLRLPRRTTAIPALAATPRPHASTLTAILLRQQTGLASPRRLWPALLAAACPTAAVHVALVRTTNATIATIVLVGMASIIFFRLTRVDGATIRFATGYGLRPSYILAAHLTAPAAFVTLTATLLLPFRPSAAATILALGLFFLWTMILRILARLLHSDEKADRMLILLTVALALLFTFLKWLTPLLLLGFTLQLAGRARQTRWILS